MISIDSKVCLVLKSEDEVGFYTGILKSMGFKSITSFVNSREAYENITRHQYDLFLTRMEVEPMSGLVLIQKIRDTGNYGLETQLFIADKVSADYIYTLQDLDLPYVLVKPFTVDRVEQKIEFMMKSESNLSEFEQIYRDAKSALFNKIYEMAHDFAKKLIEDFPDKDKGFLLLGDVFLQQGQLEEAYNAFKTVLDKDPKSGSAKIRLARISMLKHEFKEASEHLNDLAKLNPYHIKVLENAGLSNLEIDEIEIAKKHLENLEKIDQDNEVGLQIKSKVLFKDGDIQESITNLKEKLSEEELIAFINNEALKFVKNGDDFAKSISVFEESLSSLKENSYRYVLFFNLGLVYKKMGDFESARQSFISAIELNPQYEKPRIALQKLRNKVKNNTPMQKSS